MKPGSIKTIMASILTLGIVTSGVYYNKIFQDKEVALSNNLLSPLVYKEKLVDETITKVNLPSNYVTEIIEIAEGVSEENKSEENTTVEDRVVVYDDMTIEELTDKLNKSLSSDLSGMGYAYANYAVELGVDPYLAVAISMHETGCTWDCSYIAKVCNNIGGQKGTGCGQYQAFDTLEDGIYQFILNIKKNYVDYGLLTAEEMNPKYAEDPTWSSKVNSYIDKIKNS